MDFKSVSYVVEIQYQQKLLTLFIPRHFSHFLCSILSFTIHSMSCFVFHFKFLLFYNESQMNIKQFAMDIA